MSKIAFKPFPVAASRKPSVLSGLGVLDSVMRRQKFYDESDSETNQIAQKRLDYSDPAIYVFIVGKGKFGKSSLINYLLGREVAKTSIVPKTWRVDFYRTLPESAYKQEYAEIRRSGKAGVERVSLEEATHLCDEQEKIVLKHLKAKQKELDSTPEGEDSRNSIGVAMDGQIVEVSWFYRELKLPASIVLVDTPGLFQTRGASRTRTKVMSSNKGVVFESPEEAFQHYYPRADLVLWLLRADLLADRDSSDTLQNIARQGKEIIGIVSHMDVITTAEKQRELANQLRSKYGSIISTFLPVVTGGNSTTVGLGVEKLRDKIVEMGPRALEYKEREAVRFISYTADCCYKWLADKGNNLVNNLSKLAAYCNLTSQALLDEVEHCHRTLLYALETDVHPRRDSPGFKQFIKSVLMEEIPKHPDFHLARQNDYKAKSAIESYFQERIREHLGLDRLDKSMQERLRVATERVQAAGKQANAGRRLEGIILKVGGVSETRSLDAPIRAPSVDGLVVALPPFNIPLIHISGLDSLLDFAGQFMGGFMRMFGWTSTEEKIQPLILQTHATAVVAVSHIPEQIESILTGFTKQVAEAIVDGADEAISRLYHPRNLRSLSEDAATLDQDIRAIEGLRAAWLSEKQDNADQSFSYQALFQLYSPRDNARDAVIRLFCEWYNNKQKILQEAALNWFIHQSFEVIELDAIKRHCMRYLRHCNLDEKLQPVNIASITTKSKPRSLSHECDLGISEIVRQIGAVRLWDDDEDFMNVEFEHFQLKGIALDFSRYIADSYLNNTDKNLAAEVYHVELRERKIRFDPVKQVFHLGTGIGTVAIGALGTCFYVAEPVYHLTLHGSLLFGDITSFLLSGAAYFGAVYGYRLVSTKRLAFLELRDILASKIQTSITLASNDAYERAVMSITPQTARQIIGNRTLIRKQPLDYATEGNFRFSRGENVSSPAKATDKLQISNSSARTSI